MYYIVLYVPITCGLAVHCVILICIVLRCVFFCVMICYVVRYVYTFCTYGIVHIVHIVPFYCIGLRTYVHCMLNYVVL